MKADKRCGEYDTVPGLLKWLNIDDLLLYIASKASMDREPSRPWIIFNIFAIFTNTDNYSSMIAKVYNMLIFKHNLPYPRPLAA